MNEVEHSVFNTLSCNEAVAFWDQFEKDNPFQVAYEKLAQVLAAEAGDETIEIAIWHSTRNLHLSWAAARAVFGELATPEIAWRIYEGLMRRIEEADRREESARQRNKEANQ